MARIAVKLAVIFSLFIISHARTPFNLPANDFQLSTTTLSESDTTADLTFQSLRLPSEKTESDNAVPIENNLPESDPSISVTGPFKVTYDVSFRPINRHFHHMNANRPLWYRFRHRCRHNHHPRHPNGEPMVEKRLTGGQEIPYGNDMLMGDETTFHPMLHGEVGQIPAKWGEHHHHHHHHHGEKFRFPGKAFVENGGELTEENFKKFQHLWKDERKKKEEEGGFVKRFRKFISNHF